MKKIIAFSLWGNNPKYTLGAIRNAELIKTIYPGWVARFYIGLSTDPSIGKKLESLGAEVVRVLSPGDWRGMFWRFLPATDQGQNDIMLSRDADSRLTQREKEAVDEWLASDKDFHIMRDHPAHSATIMGGMWGVRGTLLSGIKEKIDSYSQGNFWQVDQNFLHTEIYPLVKDKSFVHDEFFEKKPFPTQRKDNEFVGDVFDENDTRHPEYWKDIAKIK